MNVPTTEAGRKLVADVDALTLPPWLDTPAADRIGGLTTWLLALRILVRSGVIMAEREAAGAPFVDPSVVDALNRGDGSYRP